MAHDALGGCDRLRNRDKEMGGDMYGNYGGIGMENRRLGVPAQGGGSNEY